MGLPGVTRPAKRRRRKRARRPDVKVPGPSTNPATNLLILDVATRGLAMIIGRGMEKGFLRMRYDSAKASGIVEGRSIVRSIATTGAARVASRSIPGFLLVAGGLVAKTVIDRSLRRRESIRRGEKALSKQAENADE